MKKYVKLTLCGLAAAMLVAGCSKKTDAPETTAAPETAETEAAELDKGVISKLGEYKGMEVTKMSTEVTDEELETRIQSILKANPEHIEITDRAAKNGDVVNIDFVGMKDGVAFDGGTSEGYDLELGSHSFIEGFEEGLVGAKTGDELSLNLTFPENYGNADLAGQDVVFDVTVNSIEEIREAVLDNQFVQRISDLTSVDEWKADTLADMEVEKEKQAEMKLENDALLAAAEHSEFELNEAYVDQQFNTQMEYTNSLIQMYGMSLADYATMMYGMTEEEMKDTIRTSIELGIKQQILAAAIAEKEGLQVEDADRERVAREMNMTVEDLNKNYGAEIVDESAMMYKVVAFIRDNAVVK